MTNEKETKAKPTGDKPREGKQDLRRGADAENKAEAAKAAKGQIGFYRRPTAADEIVVAIVLEVKEDKDGQLITINWQGVSIPDKTVTVKNIRVGLERGKYYPLEAPMVERIKLDRSGIANYV